MLEFGQDVNCVAVVIITKISKLHQRRNLMLRPVKLLWVTFGLFVAKSNIGL